jgi:hypothetical protein
MEWIKFDWNDQTTWPQKGEEVLVYYKDDAGLPWHGLGWMSSSKINNKEDVRYWHLLILQNRIYDDSDVQITHWCKITEPGE